MWCRKVLSLVKPRTNLQEIIRNSYAQVTKTAVSAPDEPISDISKFKINTDIHGFKVVNRRSIHEFNITAVALKHNKTKAEYLHLFRNDDNNVFSINFRTTPMKSTGLPHILEHTVLCGSEIFPIRDPFFKMLNRSLATFMNAMTASDYTMYPFSTRNLSDYKNLQRIYLDAVFQPNLKELDFMQEGWRLENVDPKDETTPLTIKGVVYNEMKGVFSENENIYAQKLQNLILPDHTYGVVSGGDPQCIPDLTWQNLKDFHKKHYHPSNCRFYSYGNFPLEPSLQYINETYLDKFEYQDQKHTEVPNQKRWMTTQTKHITGRVDKLGEPKEKQNVLTISLLMTDIINLYDTFVLQFLAELLIRGPNAPFYKAMIEPNFSGGFTSSTGFDAQPRDTIFTIGLQGLKEDQFKKVEELYDQVINDVYETGFDRKHVESLLHRYELSVRHESSNFGLNVLFGISATWNHNGDVIRALEINSLLDKLRNDLTNDKDYLKKVVKKYFIDNKHRLVLTMSPDDAYEKNQEAKEKELINRKTQTLTSEDKKNIYEKGLQLLKEQNNEQNKNLLPTLTMNDINDSVEKVPKEIHKIGPVMTQINKINSNGIVYFRSILSTSDLTPEQQMLLPLFCTLITKLGTNKLNHLEFDNLVNLNTGGLSLSVHIGESLYHLHNYEPGISLGSYCLEKNLENMWDIWSQVFHLKNITDVTRFEMLVKLYMSNLTHGIADSGHIYAMQAASGLVSGTAYQRDLLSGLQHITYMKNLLRTSNYKAMLNEILNIAGIVFDKNRMRSCFNIRPEIQKKAVSEFEKFVSVIPGNTLNLMKENSYVTGKVWTPQDTVNCQHHVLNIPVNYCSKAILTVPYTEKDFAKLRVLARLVSAKYLHPELRERQGAYGGGARLSNDGVFTFYSYRDPRNLQTLDVFDSTFKWMQDELSKTSDQDILEAKLGVFQAIDAPIAPCSKGLDEFMKRLNPDILQRHRAAVMTVSLKDLREVGEKYLQNNSSPTNSKVVLGPKSTTFSTSGRSDELWTVVDSE